MYVVGLAVLVLVPLAFFAVTRPGCPLDVNGDGVCVLALVGDSNTAGQCVTAEAARRAACPRGVCPPECTTSDVSTGGRVAEGLPRVRVENLAVPGARWERGCDEQVTAAAADPLVDGVVIACGTNNWPDTDDAILDALRASRAALEAAGKTVWLATLPRVDGPGVTRDFALVNALLPVMGATIDLHTDFDPADTACSFDGIHFTDLCRRRRADRIIAAVAGAGR